MAIIFALLFIAAVAGIIRPYIHGLKRTHFAIAAAVVFVLACFAAVPRGNSPAPTNTADDGKPAPAAATSASTDAPAPTPAQPTTKWDYSTNKDDMRGTTSKFASVASDNKVDLDFPYGEVQGTVWVRSRPKGGLDAAFEVEKGQILCNNFTSTTVSVKFDDKPIQKFECTSASDGSTQIAFIVNAKRFLSELKTAKKTIVEAEFFQKGSQQFIFDTAGLKWD